MVLVAATQLCSTANILRNLEICRTLICNASSAGAKCVFLPEASDFIAADAAESVALTHSPECRQFVEGIRDAARTGRVHVNVGVHEPPLDRTSRRISNSSLWIDDEGTVTQRYRKLHLFDVDIRDGPILKESESTEPGVELVAPFQSPAGTIGLGICFDLRFPEQALQLTRRGAEILLYPSAFAVRTGVAHWEVLLRARAIENGAWVVAAAQAGQHNAKRVSYGHAMVVDPWGSVVAQAGDVDTQSTPRLVLADIDLDVGRSVRRAMPLVRRTDIYGEV